MRRIDYAALANWCFENGYELHEWIPFLGSTRRKVNCNAPSTLQQLPEFLDVVMNLAEGERLVWIRDWTIWNERSQEIGLRMLDLLASELSITERAIDSHIYIVGAAEWRETIALLTVPILFGWDAHLFFGSGRALVDISHHGEVTVRFGAATEANADRLSAWC